MTNPAVTVEPPGASLPLPHTPDITPQTNTSIPDCNKVHHSLISGSLDLPVHPLYTTTTATTRGVSIDPDSKGLRVGHMAAELFKTWPEFM